MEPTLILAGLGGVALAFAALFWSSSQFANVLLTILVICNTILIFSTVSSTPSFYIKNE